MCSHPGSDAAPCSAEAPARRAYVPPRLTTYGDFAVLTQATTCAKGYNDGTAVGCMNSAKKS